MSLGSHDMFIAEVVNVRADERYLDPETGRFMMEKADLLAYSHGFYHSLGEIIGKFGFSVKELSRILPAYRQIAIPTDGNYLLMVIVRLSFFIILCPTIIYQPGFVS